MSAGGRGAQLVGPDQGEPLDLRQWLEQSGDDPIVQAISVILDDGQDRTATEPAERGGVMREVGPVNNIVPELPLAAGALAPLRAKAEAAGSGDFSPMWAGQAAAIGRGFG